MRILVFSDSHRNTAVCAKVIDNIIGVDMILHAGDNVIDAQELISQFPHIPVKYVRGNCDCVPAPSELIIEACGKKIFLTHGHDYNVKHDSEYSLLRQKALALGCDCAVFGHTHIPYCDASRGITLLNPGSIKYENVFGVIEIENGKLKAAVCSV